MITCYCNLLVFSEEEVVIMKHHQRYRMYSTQDHHHHQGKGERETETERETMKVLREEEKERKRACNFTNIFLHLLSLSGLVEVVGMNHILLLQSHVLNWVRPLLLVGSLLTAVNDDTFCSTFSSK